MNENDWKGRRGGKGRKSKWMRVNFFGPKPTDLTRIRARMQLSDRQTRMKTVQNLVDHLTVGLRL